MKHLPYVICILLLIFTTSSVQAQEVSFSVSPPAQQVMVKPGYIIKLNTIFTNLGDPTTAHLTIQKLKLNPASGKFELDTKWKDNSILLESSIPLHTPFNVKHNESKKTNLTLSINDNAEEKDYYFSILMQAHSSPATEGTASIKLKNTVGSLLMVTVSRTGETQSELTIPLFSPTGGHRIQLFGKNIHVFDSSQEIPLRLIVGNTGKNFTRIQGKIEVQNNFGHRVQIPVDKYLVYADSQTPVRFPSGESYLLKPAIMGSYKAQVTILDKSNQVSTQSIAAFYVFPFKISYLISCGIILVCLSYFYVSRKYKRKK